MNLSDLFIVCTHGRRSAHSIEIAVQQEPTAWEHRFEWCPGGRPITLADFEGLGEKVWFCELEYLNADYELSPNERQEWCQSARETFATGRFRSPKLAAQHESCGWRILIAPQESLEVGE